MAWVLIDELHYSEIWEEIIHSGDNKTALQLSEEDAMVNYSLEMYNQ